MVDNKAIGDRIRVRRDLIGLSQEEVAFELKVARATFGRWEDGSRGIASTDLPRVAAILKTTTAYLLGEDLNDGDEMVAEIRAAAYDNHLSEESKRQIVQYIRFMREQRNEPSGAKAEG